MRSYGIKVEYATGDIYYFGKGLNRFISYNLTTAAGIEIRGVVYKVANLERELIDKYGYATEQNAERALERMMTRYPNEFVRTKSTIVELSTTLREQMNWDAARKAFTEKTKNLECKFK